MELKTIPTSNLKIFEDDNTTNFRLYDRIDFSGISELDPFEVTSEYVNKLFAVATLKYGSSNHVDVLAIYNNIKDYFKLPLGTILRIPNLEEFNTAIAAAKSATVKEMTVASSTNATSGSNSANSGSTLNSKSVSSSNVVKSNGRLIYGQSNTKS